MILIVLLVILNLQNIGVYASNFYTIEVYPDACYYENGGTARL
jgi:hypothetical protein